MPVERERILAGEFFDLPTPADHRPTVWVIEEQRRLDLLPQPRVRIVGDPHVVFLEHDVEFGQRVGVGEHEASHAVGLELHDEGQIFARDALVIAGVVGGGERVLLATDGGEHLGEFAAGIFLGALEHQVLEKVRDTGFAGRLVGGPDLVPHHVGDDRDAVIGNDDDFEPVREREVRDVEFIRSGLRRRNGQREHKTDRER